MLCVYVFLSQVHFVSLFSQPKARYFSRRVTVFVYFIIIILIRLMHGRHDFVAYFFPRGTRNKSVTEYRSCFVLGIRQNVFARTLNKKSREFKLRGICTAQTTRLCAYVERYYCERLWFYVSISRTFRHVMFRTSELKAEHLMHIICKQ